MNKKLRDPIVNCTKNLILGACRFQPLASQNQQAGEQRWRAADENAVLLADEMTQFENLSRGACNENAKSILGQHDP